MDAFRGVCAYFTKCATCVRKNVYLKSSFESFVDLSLEMPRIDNTDVQKCIDQHFLPIEEE